MLTAAMLFFVGQALNAPTWYWVCWVTGIVLSIVNTCINLIKVGMKWNE